MDFMYNNDEDQGKTGGYTMEDLNNAIGEGPNQSKPKPAGSGMWGAVGKAATGDTDQLKEKMNKMKEMKKLQQDQFKRK